MNTKTEESKNKKEVKSVAKTETPKVEVPTSPGPVPTKQLPNTAAAAARLPPVYQFTPQGFASVNGFIIKADEAAKEGILDYQQAYDKLVYKIRSGIIKV